MRSSERAANALLSLSLPLGEDRGLLHRYLLLRSRIKSNCPGLCLARGLLPAKSLECNGLCCCCDWVMKEVNAPRASMPSCFCSVATISIKKNSSFDLRTLRAVRVLRPLKLVSGIPSTRTTFHALPLTRRILCRSSSGAQIYPESHGSIVSNRSSRAFRHHHLCYYRSRAVLGRVPHHVFLRQSNRFVMSKPMIDFLALAC